MLIATRYLWQLAVSELVLVPVGGRARIRTGGDIRRLRSVTWLTLHLVVVVGAKAGEGDDQNPNAPKPPELHVIDAVIIHGITESM